MRFLVDAQLPPALARRLTEFGHTAEHVFDIGMHEAKDRMIWKKALETGAVIISKDEDFVQLALAGAGPPFVWLRLGNLSRVALLDRIGETISQIVTAIEVGERIVEIR
jgi:predicted nuclease of predicted toxin-antitoxin system